MLDGEPISPLVKAIEYLHVVPEPLTEHELEAGGLQSYDGLSLVDRRCQKDTCQSLVASLSI